MMVKSVEGKITGGPLDGQASNVPFGKTNGLSGAQQLLLLASIVHGDKKLTPGKRFMSGTGPDGQLLETAHYYEVESVSEAGEVLRIDMRHIGTTNDRSPSK